MIYRDDIPSPYVARVHPYPSRFRGTSSVRPVFGFPFRREVHHVLMPGELVTGLGRDIDTRDGIFRLPTADGGGLFNAVSGLGTIDQATVVTALLGGVVGYVAMMAFLRRRGQ